MSMGELRDLLHELGYDDAVTHLQSGNVVLTTGKSPRRLERELERHIAERLGVETEVFVRTRDELAEVVEHDPFRGIADDPSRYAVRFLSAKPDFQIVRKLCDADVAPDRFAIRGREIYLWHPGGLHRSMAAALLSEERLGVRVTARNWNTVTKLLELADS